MDIRKNTSYQKPANDQPKNIQDAISKEGRPKLGTLAGTPFDPNKPVGADAPGAPI